MIRTYRYLAAVLLSLCAMGAVSCTQPTDDAAPLLEILEDEVQVSGDGGVFSVGYRLDNPVSQTELIAQSEEDWIHDIVCDDNVITFEVDANEDGMDRESTVIVTYTEGIYETFKVIQGVSSEPFEIIIDENATTETTVTMSVYPKNQEVGFILMTAEKDYYEELEAEGTAFQVIIEYLRTLALQSGMSLEDFMDANGVLRTGDQESVMFKNFYPATEHYIMAVGCTPEGLQATELMAELFRTKTPDKIDIDFDLDFSVEAPIITLNIAPDNADQYYFSYVLVKEDLDNSGMTVEDYVSEVMQVNIRNAASYGVPPEELVKQLCFKGEASLSFSLIADTEFIGLAAAVSDQCWVVSDVATTTIKTDPVEMSDNRLFVSIKEVSVEHVKFAVTTTNDDPYGFVIVGHDDLQGTEEEIIQTILQYREMINDIPGGDWEGFVYRLLPEQSYDIYVFGYDLGIITTGLTKVEFTTLAPGDPSKFTFTSEVYDLTTTSATVKVISKPSNILYYFSVAEVGESQEEILASFDANIQRYIDYGLVSDRHEYFEKQAYRGEREYVIGSLDQNVDYVVWAVSIDEYTDEYVVFGFGEEFRLPDNLTPQEDRVEETTRNIMYVPVEIEKSESVSSRAGIFELSELSDKCNRSLSVYEAV